MEVSVKSRLIKILPKLAQRPRAFNITMEKAERLWGANEDILRGYAGKNFNTNLPSHETGDPLAGTERSEEMREG